MRRAAARHKHMREDREERLFEVADGQAGYFTAKQALEAGYGYPLQHYHRERGHWVPVGHGLFRLRRYPEGENEHLTRLWLWSRNREGEPQAVISHETALALWDLSDLMPEKVHLSVPRGFRKRAPAGVIVHKAELAEGDVGEWGGLPVTTPLRTLLDVAKDRRVSPEHLEAATREAIERGLVRPKKLREVLSLLEDEDRREVIEDALEDLSGALTW